jgi:hypothetical protein
LLHETIAVTYARGTEPHDNGDEFSYDKGEDFDMSACKTSHYKEDRNREDYMAQNLNNEDGLERLIKLQEVN